MTSEEKVEIFIKQVFAPVEDKPGYVWLSRRNFQIISIKTLQNRLCWIFQIIDKYKVESEEVMNDNRRSKEFSN